MFPLKQEKSGIKNAEQLIEYIKRYNQLRSLDYENRPKNYSFVMPGIRSEISDYLLQFSDEDNQDDPRYVACCGWIDDGYPVIDEKRTELFLSVTN